MTNEQKEEIEFYGSVQQISVDNPLFVHTLLLLIKLLKTNRYKIHKCHLIVTYVPIIIVINYTLITLRIHNFYHVTVREYTSLQFWTITYRLYLVDGYYGYYASGVTAEKTQIYIFSSSVSYIVQSCMSIFIYRKTTHISYYKISVTLNRHLANPCMTFNIHLW